MHVCSFTFVSLHIRVHTALCLSWVEKKEMSRSWTAEGYMERRRAGGKEAEGKGRNRKGSRGTLKTLTEKMTRVWGKVRKRTEEEKLRKWKEGKKGGDPETVKLMKLEENAEPGSWGVRGSHAEHRKVGRKWKFSWTVWKQREEMK